MQSGFRRKTHFPMKAHSSLRPRGFTLVELLVVLAIIAVLAGSGFAVVTSALAKARKATALEAIGAIETAVNNFHVEYSRMPKEITIDTLVDTGDTPFLNVLLGLEGNIPNPLNPRALRLLKITEGSGKKGLIYNSSRTSAEGLYDPWGGTYQIMLDGDHDQTVTPAPPGGGGRQLNGRRCAVWSNGADGVNGGGTSADDVKSWK